MQHISISKEEFLAFLKQRKTNQYDIIERKNNDYSKSTNPLQNFLLVEQLTKTTAEQWIFIRLLDKVTRLGNLLDPTHTQAVTDESIDDTLNDLANYADLLAVTLYAKNQTK